MREPSKTVRRPPSEGAVAIPLHDKTGDLVAEAWVDPDVYAKIGALRWYAKSSRGKVYAARSDNENRQTIFLHRLVLGLVRGDSRRTDHINRDTLDNRRSNLRIVTHAQNHQNRSPNGDRRTSSQYRGVCFRRDRRETPRGAPRPWQAHCTMNGKLHHLGFFASEEAAAEVAANFRREHMPYSAEAL